MEKLRIGGKSYDKSLRNAPNRLAVENCTSHNPSAFCAQNSSFQDNNTFTAFALNARSLSPCVFYISAIPRVSCQQDGVAQISPHVSGVWETENSPYDEKIHRRTVDMIPTADLRNSLDEITVKVLGVKETTAKIAAVTDTATGLTDGTLTIGDDILIEGEKVKVDEKDSAQGVFFRASDGKEYKTERRLSVNKPTQIMAHEPASLPKGSVQIVIRTKFSGSSKPLKELREITYGHTCEAKS